MIKVFALFIFFFIPVGPGANTLFAQARLVLNNNPYVVFHDSAYLVLANSSANAITLLDSGGNIISENQYARVLWNIDTASGTYTVPFTNTAGINIPLTLDITTGGIGNGSIAFSTYGDSTWDDLLYMPSDVTNMNGVCCANNSANVVDRFWEINAANYSAKPTVDITFTYATTDWDAPGNTILQSALFAQRFNPTLGWGDWTGATGTDNPANNTVSSGPVTPQNFFRSWTLVDDGSPLPIQLLTFTANCDNGNILVSWSTASQTNNAYFTIERSTDATNWTPIALIDGAGNSVETLSYQFTDSTATSGQLWYYRLEQTDFNGYSQYLNVAVASCTQSVDLITIYPNPAQGYFDYVIGSVVDNTEVILEIYDMLGQKVSQNQLAVAEGISTHTMDISLLSSSTYVVRISLSDGASKSQKQLVIN